MKFWSNPNHHEGAVRVEWHISGSEATSLHNLIEEIAKLSYSGANKKRATNFTL